MLLLMRTSGISWTNCLFCLKSRTQRANIAVATHPKVVSFNLLTKSYPRIKLLPKVLFKNLTIKLYTIGKKIVRTRTWSVFTVLFTGGTWDPNLHNFGFQAMNTTKHAFALSRMLISGCAL